MTDDTSKTPDSEGSAVTPGDDDNAADGSGGIVPDKEIGGRDGPDPTRYGDWEKNGRCIDF
jgi:hypothetical protein